MQNTFSVNFISTTLRKLLSTILRQEQLFLPSYNLMEFLTYTEFEQQFWTIIETLHFMSSFRFEPILAKTFKDWRMYLI